MDFERTRKNQEFVSLCEKNEEEQGGGRVRLVQREERKSENFLGFLMFSLDF